ncbi:MAG TPA: hypothetical protein VF844_16675, partial [Ktedonobacteraceae bacterium]
MYYRVAIQVDPSPLWQWKSTALSELSALFQWLRLYLALPHERLHIFSCASREEMNEQLVRENQGLGSTSVRAAQFLQERLISSLEVERAAVAQRIQGNERTTSIAVVTEALLGESSGELQTLDERGISALEKRGGELERGTGGDHDLPYRFTLPTAMPQVL